MSSSPLAAGIDVAGEVSPPAITGELAIHASSWEIPTGGRVELTDLTARLRQHVRGLPVREGVVRLWSLHTTCAVFVTEAQDALATDIVRLLERLAPQGGGWRHDDPAYSDCDRRNADAHLRALLLGQSVTLPLAGGDVLLGQWQRVLLGELDGPRSRTLYVQVQGVA
jgi:secondary thiamine-phosphate synthase enzyme